MFSLVGVLRSMGEALDVRPQAIRFDSPACVRVYGKGRKERMCPLWPETVAAAITAPAPAQSRRRTDLRQSLRRPLGCVRCPIQAGGMC